MSTTHKRLAGLMGNETPAALVLLNCWVVIKRSTILQTLLSRAKPLILFKSCQLTPPISGDEPTVRAFGVIHQENRHTTDSATSLGIPPRLDRTT